LRELPLEWLTVADTKVESLEPLRGLPLYYLNLDHTQVADLGPLVGMPLRGLRIDGTQVTNLTPLLDLPLEWLILNDRAQNVAALNQIRTLTDLIIPENAPYLSDLSGLTNIARLSHPWMGSSYDQKVKASMSVAEFWKTKGSRAQGRPAKRAKRTNGK
jgi:hypothetical protein